MNENLQPIMATQIDYVNVDTADNGGVIVRWTEVDKTSKQPSWKDHTEVFADVDTGLAKVAELFKQKLTKTK